ncbi:MAG: aldo/keto reductase [Clostridia bacterium]|nr:aldo/keto reductase [Clostridia bacterium]
MQYCTLGEKQASRIVMGCMRIADKSVQQVEEVIVEALQTGVNTFDHADIYGGGDSERIFGVAIRDLKIPRKQYVLQTKCGIRRLERGSYYDFSKEHIISSVEGSLKRLNTEYIDVLLLHRPDTLMEAEEVAEAFATLRADGKVLAFGVSNASASQMQLLEEAGIEIVANQIQFSLGHTAPIDAGFNVNMYNDAGVARAGDALEYARRRKIALQAWSPLQYGKIAGTFLDNERYPALNGELYRLAEMYNCSPSAVALAWVLRHPAFAQVITGTTSPEHMKQLCKATEITLSREEWYTLYLSAGKKLP